MHRVYIGTVILAKHLTKLACVYLLLTCLPVPSQASVRSTDVAVLGGGAAGVGAAIAAARQGSRVLLIEETDRLGGMISNGVCRTDIGRRESSNGLFEEFRLRVAAHYESRGQLKESNNGLTYEPDVADDHIKAMVAETTGIEVLWGYYLAEKDGVEMVGDRVTTITIQNDSGESLQIAAPVFIDATQTADILGQAGKLDVDWTYGRENMTDFNERHNGHIYVDPVKQTRNGGTGKGDRLIQAYNYRFTLQVNGYTNYDIPSDFEENLRLYSAVPPGGGSWMHNGKEYRDMWIQAIVPNNKLDINLDRVGINHQYPIASRAERKRIDQAHKNFAIGYLHYLRTERDMPELGLSGDDYDDHGHFPTTLYVREARRLIGGVIFTENDALPFKDTKRAPRKPKSIAIGTYGMDSHCVSDAEVTTRSCEGGFWLGVAPYQIPYGVIVPKRLEGLLVPHAVSGTHVGYSTTRMEPVRMNLGQAAGTAAAMAIQARIPLRRVPVRELQDSLADQGQMLKYFSDVLPGQPDFAAIQKLAIRNIFTGRGDYTYDYSEPIARWNFAKAVVQAMDLPINTEDGPHFIDVLPTHPGYKYIETLHNHGIIVGYGDGTFRPDDFANRSNAAKTVILAAGVEPPPSPTEHYTDVKRGTNIFPYVELVHSRNLTAPRNGGKFAPYDYASRGYAARLIEEFLLNRKTAEETPN